MWTAFLTLSGCRFFDRNGYFARIYRPLNRVLALLTSLLSDSTASTIQGLCIGGTPAIPYCATAVSTHFLRSQSPRPTRASHG